MHSSFQIAQTASGPVEYRREEHGPVVLVLNGGHCSRDTRLSHEKLAAAGYTVLTPSRPGYDSTPATVGRSAQAAADALAALLDTLAIPSVAVIGISAAGPTALAFAQRYPNKTSRLILEAAVTTEWDPAVKRRARWLFGRSEWVDMVLAEACVAPATFYDHEANDARVYHSSGRAGARTPEPGRHPFHSRDASHHALRGRVHERH